MPEEKKQESVRGCYFSFNRENNMFAIEFNDIIYIATPKQFNEIVYSLYMFYNEVISSKVTEAIGNFVTQDNNVKKPDVVSNSSTSPTLDNKALKLFEDVLRGKETDKPQTEG